MFMLKLEGVQKSQLAVIPENGFIHSHVQSKIARKYILWLEKELDRPLVTASTLGGEHQICVNGRRYRVSFFHLSENGKFTAGRVRAAEQHGVRNTRLCLPWLSHMSTTRRAESVPASINGTGGNVSVKVIKNV